MTSLIIFLGADVLGVLSIASMIPRVSLLHGRRAAVKAAAVLAGSLAVYNLAAWRAGLGWSGQGVALVLSALVIWAGRAELLAIVHHSARVTQEGEPDA